MKEKLPSRNTFRLIFAIGLMTILTGEINIQSSAQEINKELTRSRDNIELVVEKPTYQVDLEVILQDTLKSRAEQSAHKDSQTIEDDGDNIPDENTSLDNQEGEKPSEEESIVFPQITIVDNELVAISPDGETTPLISDPEDLDNENQSSGNIDTWARQSPSGKYIVYTKATGDGEGRTSFIFNQETGLEQQISESNNGAWGFDFSPDESQIVITTIDGDGNHKIKLIELDDTEKSTTISGEKNSYDPHFTPDRKGLIFIQSSEGDSQNMGGFHGQLLGKLMYKNLETGEVTTLEEEPGVGWSVNTWEGKEGQTFVSYSSYRNDPEHNVNVVKAHIGQLTITENNLPSFRETITPIPEGSDGHYTISGQLLIVASENYQNSQPYLVNPTTGDKVAITNNGKEIMGVTYPVISLDKQFITFIVQVDNSTLVVPVSETNIGEILNN